MSVNDENAAHVDLRRKQTLSLLQGHIRYAHELRRLEDVKKEYGEEAYLRTLDAIAGEIEEAEIAREAFKKENERIATMTDEEAVKELGQMRSAFTELLQRVEAKGLRVTLSLKDNRIGYEVVRPIR
ncbi:hypothetical protein EVC24_002 [Rhizobium phage RHph_I4]|nr:hypothetical protein EVC24_002 [Rhizobium phage RHph_I4]